MQYLQAIFISKAISSDFYGISKTKTNDQITNFNVKAQKVILNYHKSEEGKVTKEEDSRENSDRNTSPPVSPLLYEIRARSR